MVVRKTRKLPPSVIYSYLKDGALQQLKWMLGGNICQQKVYERGTFSVRKKVYNRVRGSTPV